MDSTARQQTGPRLQDVGRTTVFRLLRFTLILSPLLQSCIYRSRVEDRPLRLPESYKSAVTTKAPAQPPEGPWWRQLFTDPELDRLMQAALEHNLDLEQARARIEQASAALTLARSGYYPRVTFSGEVGRSHSTIQLPSFGADGGTTKRSIDRDTYSLSLNISYEIDLWGKVRYAAKAAGFELEASEEDLYAAMMSITAQLADAYFLAVELRGQLDLLDQTIQNRVTQLDLVKRRYLEGVVTSLDIYQAQENLARAQAQRPTFVSRLETTEHAIALLVGRFPKTDERVSGMLRELPLQVRQLPPGLPAQLLLRRPDIRAAHHRLMATDARVGAAVAAHYPSLSVAAAAGVTFDPVSFVWSILGSLTAPLFEGLRTSADVDQKKALLRQQLAAYKATLLNAVREVEDALVTGRELEARIRWLRERVEAAEGALRMSTEQYVQGLVPYLTVLTAEQSVYTARSELISARRELISARIQLARALGGGWARTSSPDSRPTSPKKPM